MSVYSALNRGKGVFAVIDSGTPLDKPDFSCFPNLATHELLRVW